MITEDSFLSLYPLFYSGYGKKEQGRDLMNRIELLVYQLVKRNPRIKNRIRDLYQYLFSLVPVKSCVSVYPMITREGYFFGFHDKNPWSFDNRRLLAHDFQGLSNIDPGIGDRVTVGFFEGEDYGSFRKIASTSCFNWQQGSMLQWLGKSDHLVFNDVDGSENIARIFDPGGHEMDMLPAAIAVADPVGKVALSYNFTRLQRYFPGYGYMHGHDAEIDEPVPSSHGINLIDIPGNRITRLFSVRDIAALQPEPGMKGAFHFLTHCLFSPSGQRFVFLHRWVRDLNFVCTRLLSCDRNGGNLHVFPTREMVSHIAWQDESHVLAYARSRDGRDSYILFRDLSEEYQPIGTEALNSDGHPSFLPGSRNWFVTDTYPDRFRRSYLILYDLLTNKRFDLGSFRQPIAFTETIRCDLHPRWNRNGSMISFDSAHTGKRALCTLSLGDIPVAGKVKSL